MPPAKAADRKPIDRRSTKEVKQALRNSSLSEEHILAICTLMEPSPPKNKKYRKKIASLDSESKHPSPPSIIPYVHPSPPPHLACKESLPPPRIPLHSCRKELSELVICPRIKKQKSNKRSTKPRHVAIISQPVPCPIFQ